MPTLSPATAATTTTAGRTGRLSLCRLPSIASTVRAKRANVEAGRYPPNFKLGLALKDLRLLDEFAARAGLPLQVEAATRSWLERAASAGAGDLDFSAVIATITNKGGRNAA